MDRIRQAYSGTTARSRLARANTEGNELEVHEEFDEFEEDELMAQDLEEVATTSAPTWSTTLRLLWPLQVDALADTAACTECCAALMRQLEPVESAGAAPGNPRDEGWWTKWLPGSFRKSFRGLLGPGNFTAAAAAPGSGLSAPINAAVPSDLWNSAIHIQREGGM